MGKQERGEGEADYINHSFGSASDVCMMPSATLPRRSYHEVVHKEVSPSPVSASCPVARLASCLAEWLVILQGVSEERGPEQPPVTCRCNKASLLAEQLQGLSRRLTECSMISERMGVCPPGLLESLNEDTTALANSLRSEVSILIPSGVGNADPEVCQQARWLLCEGDLTDVLTDTTEGLTNIVSELLGVSSCHHPTEPPMDQEIDEDIRSLVASMCSGGGDTLVSPVNKVGDPGLGKQVLERSRKRKQNRPLRSPQNGLGSPWSSSTSNLASPVKRVKRVMTSLGTTYTLPSPTKEPVDQSDQVVSLLEKKKKLVKKDGLYKFVLWREALRDEKTKLVS